MSVLKCFLCAFYIVHFLILRKCVGCTNVYVKVIPVQPASTERFHFANKCQGYFTRCAKGKIQLLPDHLKVLI